MAENVTNELLLEHMKKMQTELVAARERDAELLRRITIMEIAMTDLMASRACRSPTWSDIV